MTVRESYRTIRMYFLLCIVVVILLGSIGVWYLVYGGNSPETVFNQAMANSLSVSSVSATQILKSKDGGFSNKVNYEYDFHDPQYPKVYSKFISPSGLVSEQFGDSQNFYIRYDAFGNSLADFVPLASPPLNQWIQLRKNNVSVNSDYRNFQVGDPYMSLLGNYIFGNFSNQDQKALSTFAINNKTFNYESQKVITSTLAGQKVYVYTVRMSNTKQTAYNLEAASMLHIPKSTAQDDMDSFHFGITSIHLKLYISVASKHLLRIESQSLYDTIITDYQNYKVGQVLTAPTPSF